MLSRFHNENTVEAESEYDLEASNRQIKVVPTRPATARNFGRNELNIGGLRGSLLGDDDQIKHSTATLREPPRIHIPR